MPDTDWTVGAVKEFDFDVLAVGFKDGSSVFIYAAGECISTIDVNNEGGVYGFISPLVEIFPVGCRPPRSNPEPFRPKHLIALS